MKMTESEGQLALNAFGKQYSFNSVENIWKKACPQFRARIVEKQTAKHSTGEFTPTKFLKCLNNNSCVTVFPKTSRLFPTMSQQYVKVRSMAELTDEVIKVNLRRYLGGWTVRK